MALANIEWTGALCTVLALACAIQLLITGILSFWIPHFLSFSKTQIPTAIGLVAGCVSLPTVIRIKTSKMYIRTPNMDRIYGYTIWYQRLAIGVCGLLHLTATLMVIQTLISRVDFHKEFLKIMGQYHEKIKTKGLIDNIQWNLQCCGASSFNQWLDVNWIGLNKTDEKKRFIADLLSEYPESVLPIESKIIKRQTNQVPFSCCKRRMIGPCLHQDLDRFGTETINTKGCDSKLSSFVMDLLILECVSYSFCVILEVIIMFLLVKGKVVDSDEKIEPKVLPVKRSWSHFSNLEPSLNREGPNQRNPFYEEKDAPVLIPTVETIHITNIFRKGLP